MSFTESLSDFFADLTESAVIVTGTSTSTASVYLDVPSSSVLSGMVMVDSPSLIAQATVSLARGSTVTISTSTYTVRSVEKLDDGAIVRATLEDA